jgi:hypothetical protein
VGESERRSTVGRQFPPGTNGFVFHKISTSPFNSYPSESFHSSFGVAPLPHEPEGKWIGYATHENGRAGTQGVLGYHLNVNIMVVSRGRLSYGPIDNYREHAHVLVYPRVISHIQRLFQRTLARWIF